MIQLLTIAVGTGIGGLVLEEFDQAVKDHSHYGAKQGTNPVYPMVVIKGAQDDVRAE